jgi:arylsulfatase A-like enzyme
MFGERFRVTRTIAKPGAIRRTLARVARHALLPALLATSALVAPIDAVAQESASSTNPARGAAVARTEGPPNVIVILADDVGVEAFRLYGGSIATPNLERLANEGVTFDSAFATPLCSPSRTRLMTARENAKNYEAFGFLSPGEKTFGNLFSDAGYATSIIGKWQLSGNGFDDRVGISPEGAGFKESLLWQLKSGPSRGSRYWGPTLWANGQPKLHEEGFGPDLANQAAIDFIETNKAKPFFLYYPMVLVHDPFVGVPGKLDAEGEQAKFRGMMQYMDDLVGKLLDRVDALGLRERTLIVFTADNGTNQRIYSIRNGQQVSGGKGLPTLTGTHVPMVMSWPGHMPAGVRRSGLTDFADVLPTIADAAQLPVSWQIDGVSQLPVARGERPAAREAIYQHYAPTWVFKPVGFAFDRDRKLYSDGRYVALNLEHDVETPIDTTRLSSDEQRRYRKLKAIVDADKRPFDPVRFPWCKGRKPTKEGGDPTVVGCGMKPFDIGE